MIQIEIVVSLSQSLPPGEALAVSPLKNVNNNLSHPKDLRI
jgi:hypothetical protein